MAAKAAHLVPYQFKPAAAAAPIIIAPSRAPARRSPSRAKPAKGGHRRRAAGHVVMSPEGLMKIVLGGFVAGFVEKQFGASLPSIPLLGRKGTLTIALYFLSKSGKLPMLRDATIAAAGISGYELGSTGKITGLDDGIASQV